MPVIYDDPNTPSGSQPQTPPPGATQGGGNYPTAPQQTTPASTTTSTGTTTPYNGFTKQEYAARHNIMRDRANDWESAFRDLQRVEKIHDEFGFAPMDERYDYSQVIDSLDKIDEATAGNLPAEVQLTLAQMGLYEQDKIKAARMLAREAQVPMEMLFGEGVKKAWKTKYRDPFTGLLVSAGSLRRAYGKQMEVQFFYNLLSMTPGGYTIEKDLPKPDLGEGFVERRTGMDFESFAQETYKASKYPVSPLRVAGAFRTIGEAFSELPFDQALSYAISLAQTKTNMDIFSSNLEIAQQGPQVDVEKMVYVAHHATLSGVRFKSIADLMAYASDPKNSRLVGNAFAGAEHQLEREAVAGEKGYWESAQGPFIFSEEQIKQYRDVMPVDQKAALSVLEGSGDLFEREVANYRRINAELLKRIEEEGNESILNAPLIGPVLRGIGTVLETTGRGASTAGAYMFGAVTQDPETMGLAGKIWSKEMTGVEVFEAAGLSHWQALLFDITNQVVFDPLNYGGSLLKMRGLGKLVSTYHSAEALGAAALRNLSRRVPLLGNKSIATFLLDEAVKSLDEVGDAVIDAGRRVAYKPSEALNSLVKGTMEPWQLSKSEFQVVYNMVQDTRNAMVIAGTWDESSQLALAWKKLNATSREIAANPEAIWAQHISDAKAAGAGFYNKVDSVFFAAYRRHGIDPDMARVILNHVGRYRGVRTAEQLTNDIKEFWLLGLGAKAGPDTFAGKMFAELDAFKNGAKAVPTSTSDEALFILAKGEEELDNALMDLEHILQYYGGGPRIYNLPAVRLTAPFRMIGSGMDGSSALAKAMRTLGKHSKTTGMIADIERNLPDWVDAYLTRSREFSKSEINAFKARAAFVSAKSTKHREKLFEELMHELNDEIIRREATKLGLTEEMARSILDSRLKSIDNINTQAFGFNPETGAVVRTAQFSTQLRNRMAALDPVEIRRILHDATGNMRAAYNAMRRGLGLDPTDVYHLLDEERILVKARELVKDAHRSFMHFWKPAVVVSPRYIMRVPMGDEQLRFMADLGVWARLGSLSLASKARRVAGIPDEVFEYTMDISKTAWLDRSVTDVGFTDVDEAFEAMKVVEGGGGTDPRLLNLSQTVQDTLRNIGSVDGPTITMRMRLPDPGSILDDAAASTSLGQSEIYQTWLAQQKYWGKYVNKVSWDPIKAAGGKKGLNWHLAQWEHTLNNQYGLSVEGREILKKIADGWDKDRIVDYMNDWYVDGHMDIAEDLGFRFSKPHLDWRSPGVEAQVEQIWKDTMHNPTIAKNSLDRTITKKWLNDNIPVDQRPTLHGIASDYASGGVYTNTIKNFWDTTYKFILQTSTNKLTRQPYFKAWYTRMRRSMLDVAKDSGKELTDELLAQIDGAAREFAIDRVKDIMFDFREQGRLAEMLSFAFPFMQPFQEALTVWPRLARSNPNLVPIAQDLFNAGTSTGFIKKDPNTGEYVIPFTWYAGAAGLLHMTSLGEGGEGLPGWTLTGNLSSLNFFMSSMFQVPLGKGHLPLPMPGMSPLATSVAQTFSDSEVIPEWIKDEVQDYVFQFGDLTSAENLVRGLTPAWFQHFMNGAIPGWGDESQLKSLSIDMIRLLSTRGVTAETIRESQGISASAAKEKLANMAMSMARELEGVRAFYSLFMPIAPQIHTPTEGLELEFRELVDSTGSYLKASKKFIADHPGMEAITIPSTFWAGKSEAAFKERYGEVPLPTNEDINKILDGPEFREWAQQNPRWAFALIPGELWSAEFDRAEYFRQLDEGIRQIKDPLDYLNDLDVRQGWEAFYALQRRYQWEKDRLLRNAPEGMESSVSFDAIERHWNIALENLKADNPSWAVQYVLNQDAGGIEPGIIREAEIMTQNPVFMATEVGEGTAAYLKLREEIRQEMVDNGWTSMYAPGAMQAKIAERFQGAIDDIIAQYPDWERAYFTFFKGDLQQVEGIRAQVLNSINRSEYKQNAQRRFDMAYQKQLEAIDLSLDASGAENVRHYLQLKILADGAYNNYKGDFNPMINWWDVNQYVHDSYKTSVLTRPFSFLSRFDRETVLGMNTTPEVEKYWLNIAEQTARIAKWRDENEGGSSGPLYDQLNAIARGYAKENKVFAKQLKMANTWGGAFFAYGGYTEGKTGAAMAWRAFRDTLWDIQEQVDSGEFHGTDDYDRNKAEIYGDARNQLEKYVSEYLFDYSPGFKRQWETIERQLGSKSLIAVFMPDTYFKLG